MFQQFNPALRLAVLLTVLTGLIYPGLVTALCQTLFREKANGSLIYRNGQVVGSKLIGQNFARPEYFHPRPSAAGNDGYDPTSSGGSNLGPTSEKLVSRVKSAAAQFRAENPEHTGSIPSDAVTTSGSGLDPDISVANAYAQSARVATARGVADGEVNRLVRTAIQNRGLGFLGEPHVNVLELNLTLDQQLPKK